MTNYAKRAMAACAALLIGLGFSLPTAAEQAEKRTVRVYVIPITDVAPLYAAKAQGYFDAEGLNVEMQSGAGGAVGIPGLIGGAYDFAFSNVVSIIQARAQGLGVKIVAPGSDANTGAPDIAGIFARSDDALKTGADLEGKTVAVNTRNNIIWLYARQWISFTGGDPSKVRFREIPFPQMVDAVKRKQADAAFAVEPFYSIALNDNTLSGVAFPYAEVQPGANLAQYIATEDYIQKNPETVEKFVRALRKGAEWINQNAKTPAYFDLVAGYSKLDPALISKLSFAQAPTSISFESIEKTVAIMKENGMLDTPVDTPSLVFGDVQ